MVKTTLKNSYNVVFSWLDQIYFSLNENEAVYGQYELFVAINWEVWQKLIFDPASVSVTLDLLCFKIRMMLLDKSAG